MTHELLLGPPRPPQRGETSGISTAYRVEHLSKVTCNTCLGLERNLMRVESGSINVRDINAARKPAPALLYYSLGKTNLLIVVQLRYFGACP